MEPTAIFSKPALLDCCVEDLPEAVRKANPFCEVDHQAGLLAKGCLPGPAACLKIEMAALAVESIQPETNSIGVRLAAMSATL